MQPVAERFTAIKQRGYYGLFDTGGHSRGTGILRELADFTGRGHLGISLLHKHDPPLSGEPGGAGSGGLLLGPNQKCPQHEAKASEAGTSRHRAKCHRTGI